MTSKPPTPPTAGQPPDLPDRETPHEEPLEQPHAAEKPWIRTHTPRPDELSRESFEFIAAIDEYKRRHLRSFLADREVLLVLRSLGYRRGSANLDPTEADLSEYAAARARYRAERGRLFPTWSEVFQLLIDLGYRRQEPRDAA